jgi:glyoxylase-like metal-dependent hydrolase (beta-lactamase superfamily II)
MARARIERIEGRVMAVNSYLVEGSDGIVIVDGMLTVSDARAVRKRIDEIGKPVLGALVTHAHPDHYAGLGEMLGGREVRVVATRAVREVITRDDATKDAIVAPMMGDEWPKRRIFPQEDIAPGTTLRFGDLAFDVEEVGPAESPADSIYRLDDRTVFVGDLVYAGMHAYLADGHAPEWIATLDRLEKATPQDATLYAGHGAPGGIGLFDAQRRYIDGFVSSVERHLGRAPDERRAAVVADMKAHLPSENLLFLMELSVDPFAAKLSGRERSVK